MDFDTLPDKICLKIFLNHPLRHQIQIGSVNRRFQQISSLAVSETRSLNLAGFIFQKISLDSLRNILELCHNKLESVSLHQHCSDRRQFPQDRLSLLGQFSLPRLTKIEIGRLDVRSEHFRSILSNCPNLRQFDSNTTNQNFQFPDVVCEKLSEMSIFSGTNQFLHSLIGKCPNLIDFGFLVRNGDAPPTENVLNEFMTDLKLEKLFLHFPQSAPIYRFDNMENLWKMTSLQYLFLTCDGINDWSLKMIVRLFPNLKSLRVSSSRTIVSAQALGWVKDMKNLLEFESSQLPMGGLDRDQSIRELVMEGHYRMLYFSDTMTPVTLIACIRSNPLLEYLRIFDIDGIDTVEAALALLESLEDFRQEKIMIELKNPATLGLWYKPQVKAAIQEMREKTGGYFGIEQLCG